MDDIQATRVTPPSGCNYHFVVSLDASLFSLPFRVTRGT